MVASKSLDLSVIDNVHIDKNCVDLQVKKIIKLHPVHSVENSKAWLLRAITVIDLTTLAGDDTKSNVVKLCIKAAYPISPTLLKKLGLTDTAVRTAAICVYPNRVADAHAAIKRLDLLKKIQIASVATGFPSGLYPLNSRLEEIKFAIASGATEIDVVLDRSLVLMGKWEVLFEEVMQMKKECGDNAHLKVILGVGELGTYENVYKASMVSMCAGADFIKTSTGKEAVNATLPIGLVMCRAIRNYYLKTGRKVGLKPAGGIKTAQDAINWLVLVYTELGPEWLTPELFRIGASSLLDVIEKKLDNLSTPIKEHDKILL